MRRTKEQSNLTRQALLRTALLVFSRKGYAATTLEDIVLAAKVTRGALYHHFSGKAEIFDVLLEEAIAAPSLVVQRILAEGTGFLEVIYRVFVEQIIVVETDAMYRATVELVMFQLEASPELESARQRLQLGRRTSLELLAQSFADGIRLGQVRRDLEPSQVALMFLSLQIGLFQLWHSNPTDLKLELSARALADVLIAGIRA